MPGPSRPPDLPRLGSLVFMAFGALIALIGVLIVPRDPGGFFAILFGAVFIGVGVLVRRLFALPEGRREIVVAGHSTGVIGTDGRTGVRSQAVLLDVPADATAGEISEARQAWVREQWGRRPDWVEGRIVSDDVRNRGLVHVGAWIWSVIALLTLGAALLWGGFAWLFAAGGSFGAVVFIVQAVRIRARSRKFGVSHLLLAHTPLVQGGRCEGRVEIDMPLFARVDGPFRITLRCVHRWEESTGTGNNRRTHRRRDTLWETEDEASARPGDVGQLVPFAFDLPADRPVTTLGGGSDGILWELSMDAAAPGVDYHATFELPVLDASTATLLTHREG